MGPDYPTCIADWLRREDSNLQSPDPESGGLPISRLLSTSLHFIARCRACSNPQPETFSRGAPHATAAQDCVDVLTRGGAIAQGFSVMIYEFVAALQEGRIMTM